MRCPFCDTENEEGAEFCRKCGEELPQARAKWEGPQNESQRVTPAQVASASDEWDPAKLYSKPRPASAFVPPARYPTHVSWIITILVLGIPATAIHAILFYRGVRYPHNLEIAVGVILALSVPLSLVASLFAGMVNLKHRSGDDVRAYRYSWLTGLFCWISLVASLALYVILFLRLIYSVGEFWGY
jgi:hypothetical protein